MIRVVLQGGLFPEIGCAGCHAQLTTGVHDYRRPVQPDDPPYTHLLLHDMGEGLADGRPDFLATGNEWRTPPLWGLGLIATVNGHTNLLHDGAGARCPGGYPGTGEASGLR